jgi:hypothetical protein
LELLRKLFADFDEDTPPKPRLWIK